MPPPQDSTAIEMEIQPSDVMEPAKAAVAASRQGVRVDLNSLKAGDRYVCLTDDPTCCDTDTKQADDAMQADGANDIDHALARALLAECIGTFFIVVFGCGSVLSTLSGAYSGVWRVAAVWGFGVALSIYATAEISGAHLNPAITLAFFLVRPQAHGMTPARAVLYVLAQLVGAILAGALNLVLHGATLRAFERKNGIV